jgi:hypothetical protein
MTNPVDPTTLKGSGGAAPQVRATLVFYHRDGATVASLMKGDALVAGRTAPAHVVIPDPGLSRQHARFTWDDQGIWVEDLGSTNGTRRNGEAVTRAKVSFGDELTIGPVMVSLHVMWPTDAELRGFDSHDRFVAALGDEVVRARTFERSLAVVMVRAAGAKDGHVGRWASRLRERLRPVDRVGIYGPTAVLVSLPETGAEAARAFTAALSDGDPPLVCGTAIFPGDGGSAEELIAAVQSATRAGDPRSRRATAPDVPAPAGSAVIVSPVM